MAWRPHGHARVNPDNPRSWATCDRCGFNYNHYMLSWQWDWGGFQLVNQRILVCDTCLDKPAAFLKAIILPPDPPPLFNVRPEPYTLDEQGPTQTLIAELEIAASSITVLYLDLFNGDPSDGGESQLETLNGSDTRTNFVASMGSPVDLVATNTASIALVDTALASADITFLAAYDAATAGNLIAASTIIPQTVVLGNGLAIPVGDLRVQVQP